MSRHMNKSFSYLVVTIAIAIAAWPVFRSAGPSTAMAAATTAPAHGEATAAITTGDSRTNNYRLERDSCCVGQD